MGYIPMYIAPQSNLNLFASLVSPICRCVLFREESLKSDVCRHERVGVIYANVLYEQPLTESSGIENSSLKNEKVTSEWF